MSLSASPVPQTGVFRSIFESLRLGRSSQSIASGLLRFWISLNFKNENSVIHGFISAGCANHYMPSLKAGSIVVDPFLIRFISPTIIDEVITGAPEINLQS
ncbi:hypothetical protein DY000_02032102 [Brassica cretica]|uniref:Uncharacterized protein n=2 Tax=Brassica TaxID=3705 RepID=A0A0D3BWL0_BRAOL|nr:hypothetical protein DY000_02032102 [Brassica cretica]